MVHPPTPEARLRAIVSGRVQGVNFRYYTVKVARRLGITGWVANRWDGTVETVAEGGSPELRRYVAQLHEGSPSSHVDEVAVSWTEAPTGEFGSFSVRFQ
jgi:acylphosphatase